MSVLYAATYPARTVALVTFGILAKRIWSPDYPWAPTPEQRQKDFALVEREWDGQMDVSHYAPSADAALRARIAAFFRRSASPGAALTLLRMNTQIDVRHVLRAVRIPALVLGVDERVPPSRPSPPPPPESGSPLRQAGPSSRLR
jgi:pimeloyl-ACP methyl ester carboxylesterase